MTVKCFKGQFHDEGQWQWDLKWPPKLLDVEARLTNVNVIAVHKRWNLMSFISMRSVLSGKTILQECFYEQWMWHIRVFRTAYAAVTLVIHAALQKRIDVTSSWWSHVTTEQDHLNIKDVWSTKAYWLMGFTRQEPITADYKQKTSLQRTWRVAK